MPISKVQKVVRYKWNDTQIEELDKCQGEKVPQRSVLSEVDSRLAADASTPPRAVTNHKKKAIVRSGWSGGGRRHGGVAGPSPAARGNCSYTLPPSWRISLTIRRMLRGVGLISSPSKNFTHSILFKTRLKRPINDSFGVQIEVVDSQNLCLLRKTSRRPSRRRLSMMAAPVRQASGSPRQDVCARVNGTCFGHEPRAHAVRRASVV